MNTRQQQLQAFNRLLDIMDDLREKCPWDMKANATKVCVHLTIEETYELRRCHSQKTICNRN